MSVAYIGMGSNLGDPISQIRQALRWLTAMPEMTRVRAAPLIVTKALGPVQPDYVNTVAEVDTSLSPVELLRMLQRLEGAATRRRTVHWGARTLDLDLLLYDDLCLDHPDLVLPHPRLHQRTFVLGPLLALTKHKDPPLKHPRLDRTLADLLLAVEP